MIDTTTLQKKVDAVKTEIRNDSITPLIIGSILSEFLNLIRTTDLTDWKLTANQAITALQSSLSTESTQRTSADNDLQTSLSAEITQRSSADNELRAAIALLRRALDESEDGTFAQTVREDIRDIFDVLSMIRDDQKLSQEDIDQIKADIESILGENASEAIENFNEILNFLEGVKDTDSLLGLLDNIRQTLRDNARDLQSHEDNDKTHINVLSLADEEDLDDATGTHVRPGLYRIRLGAHATQPDRDGDLLLFNVWGRWDYTVSEEDGTWSVPVQRLKINREGVWVQSGTYSSDNLYSHGQWQSLTSLLLSVKNISENKADRTELSNILGTPTEHEIENIEPSIATDALRKTTQTLTPEEQEQVKKNIGISKMELFIDLYNAAFKVGVNVYGKYDPENAPDAEHPFMGNTIWMTYEEAIEVMIAGRLTPQDSQTRYFQNKKLRTVLPASRTPAVINGAYTFEDCTLLEIVDTPNLVIDTRTFRSCINLRTTSGYHILKTDAFERCSSLENLTITGWQGKDVNLRWSPLINLASIGNIVERTNAAITITVHPDVYAKLTDEANTEWHQVLLDAADKNITFTTV